MKKKYLAGILTAALLTGTLFGCGSQGTAAPAPAESQVESQPTESVDSKAQSESTVPEETPTESPVATPTPEPAPDYSAAYAAYLNVLQENQRYINAYDWQKADLDVTEASLKPVALADVYGDGTPELLYMRGTAGENNEYYYKANLVVSTYEDGTVKTLYDEQLDVAVAGGTFFCVFAGSDKTLYIYSGIGDEGVEYNYTRLAASGSALAPAEKISHSSYPTEDYSSFVDTYYIEGAEVPHEDYEKIKSAWYDNTAFILLTSFNDDEFLVGLQREQGSEALTYDEAVAKLKELADGGATSSDTAANGAASVNLTAEDIFGALNGKEFGFASGVGAWSSDLTFANDGIFMGSFHDSDMGDTGDGYPNGTIYVSDFSGRFEIANVINDHSVTLRLVESGTSEPVGNEWIDDQVRYVASDPYGIAGGDEFILYFPGTPMSELTDDGRQWYQMPRALSDDELPQTLPCYGLYNVNEANAFFSFE